MTDVARDRVASLTSMMRGHWPDVVVPPLEDLTAAQLMHRLRAKSADFVNWDMKVSVASALPLIIGVPLIHLENAPRGG